MKNKIHITRWSDEIQTNIKDVEQKLNNIADDEHLANDVTRYVNWFVDKKFNKRDVFNGKEIEYSLFTFSVDQISIGKSIDDDSVTKKTGFFIVYEFSGKIRYIIDKYSGAMTIIRKMLGYAGRKEIKKVELNFTTDIFIWLISKIYNKQNNFEGGGQFLEDLTINSIRGFKGDTEDSLNTIDARGESVMNIISALSFLIESKNLNQINIDLEYKNHKNIDVVLNNQNSIILNPDRYSGELFNQSYYEQIAKIIFVLHNEVFPIIIENYQNDIDSNIWNNDKCVDFLQQVADDLSVKVENRIKELREKPEQLTIKLN